MDLRKYALPAALLALVAVMAFTVLGRGEDAKTLTAHFPRAISVFEGSDVRVLGVSVGKVDSVTPSGTEVIVKMHYSGVTLPEDAQAIIVAPSIVGDRFVQLTPVFGKGDTAMEDGAVLRADRTSVPLELDQVYASLDDLNVALGPTGANKHGALSDLLAVTADNFDGQGKGFRQTIADFSTLTGTLDRNRNDLFGTAAKLQRFLRTLAENDQTVRQFNGSLARVSEMLAGERKALTSSLRNLGLAMRTVSKFVKDNRASLGRNITGLNRVSKVLVKQRDALDEVLRVGPLALNNLALTYNPQAGTLDTRANLGEIVSQLESNPALLLCSFVGQLPQGEETCDTIKGILPRPGAFTGGARGQDVFDPTLGGLVQEDDR